MHTQEFVLFILSELVFVSRKNFPGNKNKSKKNKRTKSHLSKVSFIKINHLNSKKEKCQDVVKEVKV